MSKVTLNIKPTNQPTFNAQQEQKPRLIPLNNHGGAGVPVRLNLANTVQNEPNPIKLNVAVPQQNPAGAYRITADAYHKYDTTREHIYNITDTYIGSDEQVERPERVLNLETMCFEEEQISVPEGVERIYVEISSNAGDNVARSLRHGIDPGEVTITMDRHTITVRNGGIPIPIEIHPKLNVWAPHVIFGMLHTSSNYDKTKVRTECGRNGYGAKLTNIFSKKFTVTIGDHHNKKWYKQEWTNNMTVVSEPEIKSYDGPPFVEIVYHMDFERFGYEYYPDEAFRLFARHAADMSFTGKVPVSFNGIKLNVQKSRDYAKLYLGKEIVKNSIVYYQWAPGVKTIEKRGIEYAVDAGVVPMIEICAVDTPDTAINVSFVNGMWTRLGGVHADAAFKAIASGLLTTVNGGNKKKSKKQKRSLKLNLGDVKRHVSMFVSCWLGNPKFDGQTKTALRSPTPKIAIDDKILQPIMKWNLINRLYAELDAKHYKASAKTDGKKSKYVADLKGEDANDAGTVRSGNCTLYIVEGKSAMGFAAHMVSLYDNGRDFIGILPLKGKPLNVMNADPTKIRENEEIIEIKRMLGLRDNVNYLLDENFNTLRYGHVVVLADADNDGKHILGLVLNLFHCRYPSLLAKGYVKYLRTKILQATKNRQAIKFYNNNEFERWKTTTPDWKTWTLKYFKGLGTSKPEDVADEFKAPRIVQCFYDDLSPQTLQLAFHEKFADQRKEWIRTWMPDHKVEEMQMQPISAFINHELIQFSIADLARSIPRWDGLKVVQRKIVAGAMKRWGKGKKTAEIKTANLASYVSDKMEYHHGEKSIQEAINNMAHIFVGSNNMNVLFPSGMFGCVDPDTPILLWNGTTVMAKNIKVGDYLIGDDGKKRTVKEVVRGIDTMYKINQAHGDSYIVNSIHILSLVVTCHKKINWEESTKSWILHYIDHREKEVKTKTVRTNEMPSNHHNSSKITKDEGYRIITAFRDTIPDDDVIDIPLNEYLKLSETQRNMMYGLKNREVIQWPKQDVPIDPYIMGTWLGNGDINQFSEMLKKHNLYKNKHVLDSYIYNDEKTRLGLLAGLIDTSGTLKKHSSEKGYHFEIFQKDDHGHIIDSVKIIASSLGFKTSIHMTDGMKCLMISGTEIYKIPTLLPRKSIKSNVLPTDPLVTKISVEKIGTGVYCGWTIDGNKRFLLGDFTVTHNTRNMLGKDASAARYTYTRPEWWWKFIFKDEDKPLLKMTIVEGKECEPEVFLPIIPLALVNGVKGIGTGHSTFIPNHDPLDICNWITCRIKGYPLPAILPWYRGFEGTIALKERGKKRQDKPNAPTDVTTPNKSPGPVLNIIGGKQEDDDDELDMDDEDYDEDEDIGRDAIAVNAKTTYTMVTTGCFKISGNKRKTVTVTELPIGRSIHSYNSWLQKQKENKVISGFTNHSKHDKPKFTITGMKNPTAKNLRLIRSFGMSNMVLLDTNDRPIKYNSVSEIMETFYNMRLPFYQARKDNIIKGMEDRIILLNNKIRFIIAVINGYNLIKQQPNITIEEANKKDCILVLGLNKKQIQPQMSALGFPEDLMRKVTLHQCTQEEMFKARDELESKINEKSNMEKIKPEDMWQTDIDCFVAAYCKHYKCKPTIKNKVTLNVAQEFVANNDE